MMLVPVNYSISLLPFSLNTIDIEKIKAVIDKQSRDFLQVSIARILSWVWTGFEWDAEVCCWGKSICILEQSVLCEDHYNAHVAEPERDSA